MSRWKTLLPLLKKEEKEIKKQGLKVQAYGESSFPLPLSFTVDPPAAFFNWAKWIGRIPVV